MSKYLFRMVAIGSLMIFTACSTSTPTEESPIAPVPQQESAVATAQADPVQSPTRVQKKKKKKSKGTNRRGA